MRLLTLLILCATAVSAQDRIDYAVKDQDTLFMLHYEPQGTPNGMTIMHVHGGGFSGGSPGGDKAFATSMQERGYNVFSISYRLFLKGSDFGCGTTTPVKLKAISTAVEDVADAAKFLLDKGPALKVDTSKLYLSGSSAGAEAILHLLYNPFAASDPARYDYFTKRQRFKGALVFAGGLVDINPVQASNWVPTLFMHGTADELVPFGTAAHRFCRADQPGWMIMFGDKTIYDTGRKMQKDAILYTYVGRGHEVSNYMNREAGKINDFLQKINAGKKIGATQIIVPKGK
ncbi:alpha/beta hydrolase family protein [Chitinophaga rhizosphaerae]|uniref:alpha/beta hydrolase family protein n=1 Tax=Chitinophaga rhizosphaerae TaxID=1864947 RepID=UPI000F804D44|nr:hypothetical protein [Chitinophaga rhizosphaerae]